MTTATHTKTRLEKQGKQVILRTIEPVTYGRDKVIICHSMVVLPSIQWRYQEGIIYVNTLRPTQNGRHFTDDIFKSISLNV